MANEYKTINETTFVSVDNFRGCSLKSIKEAVGDMIEQYGDDAVLDFDIEYGYYDEVSIDANLTYSRPETEKEYKKRLGAAEKRRKAAAKKKANAEAKAEKAKAKLEANERAELARLTKKYGE